MRWVGILVPAVCASRLLGAEPLTGCLAAVQTAATHGAAGRWTESERELLGIIANASGGTGLCLGIAFANMAVLRQRRGEVKGVERYALQSVAVLEKGGPECEIALAR